MSESFSSHPAPGLSVTSLVRETDRIDVRPCPDCGSHSLVVVVVDRTIRLFRSVPVNTTRLEGLKCPSCAASFLHQVGVGRTMDITFMIAGVVVVIACSLLQSILFIEQLAANASMLLLSAFGALAALLWFFSYLAIRSAGRRLGILSIDKLTAVDETFSEKV